MNDAGVKAVQTSQKIKQGKKNIESITSGERGQLVTAVYAICANQNVGPSIFTLLAPSGCNRKRASYKRETKQQSEC